MGNYKDFENEFVQRTLELISQYDAILGKFPPDKQYNHTLLINCLLGLILMTKERIEYLIPKNKITDELKEEMGLIKTYIDPQIKTLKNLILALRNSIAHFKIQIVSRDAEFKIDEIHFHSKLGKQERLIAVFDATELLPFVSYYGTLITKNNQVVGK